MARRKTNQNVTDTLRELLAEVPSMRAVARETGVDIASIIRFVKGQSSMRLDRADALFEYFSLELRKPSKRGR